MEVEGNHRNPERHVKENKSGYLLCTTGPLSDVMICEFWLFYNLALGMKWKITTEKRTFNISASFCVTS